MLLNTEPGRLNSISFILQPCHSPIRNVIINHICTSLNVFKAACLCIVISQLFQLTCKFAAFIYVRQHVKQILFDLFDSQLGHLYISLHHREKEKNMYIVIWLFVYPVECTKGHITKVNIKYSDDIFSEHIAVAE